MQVLQNLIPSYIVLHLALHHLPCLKCNWFHGVLTFPSSQIEAEINLKSCTFSKRDPYIAISALGH